MLLTPDLSRPTDTQRAAHGDRDEVFCTRPGLITAIPGFGTRMCGLCGRPLDIDRPAR